MPDKQDSESIEYQSVLRLKGVGPAVATKLQKLGIETLQDVLFHLPYRYEDRTRVVPIGSLRPGDRVVIEGVIEHTEIKFSRNRKRRSGRSLLCLLSDGTGRIILRFFYFSSAQQAQLAEKKRVRCFGECRAGSHVLEMVHPEYSFVPANQEVNDAVLEETLTPVYPATEGVHQILLRKLAAQVVEKIKSSPVNELLPEKVVRQHGLQDINSALIELHQPVVDGVSMKPEAVTELLAEPATRTAVGRLAFEELVAHRLGFMQFRNKIRKQNRSLSLEIETNSLNAFYRGFSFELTRAQLKVIEQIREDLNQTSPMLRLLQGDVGSGKTAVAVVASFIACSADMQTALMVPTEILAEQHYSSFVELFSEDVCVLLTGKDKGESRRKKLKQIKNGSIKIIIGTHALFQGDVEFSELALVIIDEQHRFGVHQRLSLMKKNTSCVPHQLIMTATPIPRSLAMTAYADLDYSVIDELPGGRKKINTVVISSKRRIEVMARIEQACKKGEQAYWVCTLIEESEQLQCQAAEDTANLLSSELTEISIGLIHGRMKAEEKQAIIERFRNKDIQLLVATTVIEVGVDVPSATLMVIENAERLGLAQLHQLRGRVGRGNKQSACVLMYQSPVSQQAKQRLNIMRETNSGFLIAEKDLEMRGPGEMLGTRQAGLVQLKIADVVRDKAMLPAVQEVSSLMINHYPQQAEGLIRRWLGSVDRFGSV